MNFSQRLLLPLGLILSCASARAHVSLDAPTGGEVVTVGSTIEIRWHVAIAHNTQDWDLWYSTTGPNGPWIPLATDLPPGDISSGAQHTFVWRVPAGLSGTIHVRVRQDNTGTDYFDISKNEVTVSEAPARYSAFGSGCPGSAGTPSLSGGPHLPRIAEPFEVDLQGLPPSSAGAFIVIGFSKTQTVDLTDLGMPGCSSFLSLDLALPLNISQGSATWSFVIPGELALIGTPFYNQGFILDAQAGNSLGAVVTNAAEGLIGAR